MGELTEEGKVQEANIHEADGIPDNRDLLQEVDENQVRYEKAGFWIRFGAAFVDFTLFSLALNLVGGTAALSDASTDQIGIILYCVFFILYPIVCIGTYGQTLGKKVFGLRVLRTDFSRVSYGWAILRWMRYALVWDSSNYGKWPGSWLLFIILME